MEIWNQLSETNPKYTKEFKKGFSGTAINPTYGMKKLTEVFGPCGDGWGEEIIESRFDEGVWLSDRDREVIHTIILRLWYVLGGIKHEVIGVGTTTFIGKNKHGVYTDEEYFKKTMTDALTNASKKLGNSADVFMGLYDDSKYLNEVKQKFAEAATMPKRAAIQEKLMEIDNLPEYNKYATDFSRTHGDDIWNQLTGNGSNKKETYGQLFNNREKKLKGLPPVDANTDPADLQIEWDKISDTCSDLETLETLETQVNQNRKLDTTENWAILEELHKKLD